MKSPILGKLLMLPLEFRKYFHSIFVIYFFKYFLGKINPVDAPSPLPVMAWVCVYIFVIRLQKPEINPVGIMPWRCVGTKKDPILIFDHELSACVGLPSELTDSCVDIHIHIGILFKPHRDRKGTRLNSSHVAISYAVFCLKKKKTV